MWLRAALTVALRGPGKALLAASVTGWIVLACLLNGDRVAQSAVTMGHGDHGVLSSVTPMPHSSRHFTVMWLAMILAMAPPLLRREIGRLWRTSLHRRRHLTLASFLCGYGGVWLLVGVAMATVVGWVMGSVERIAVAIALVTLWHCSPGRQRCLNACHRMPSLRVFGMAAQWDALRYGLTTGWYCAGACGLAMLLALIATDHHVAAMAVVTVVATIERHVPARRPRWRLPIVRGRSLDWPQMPVVTSRP